MRINLLPLEYRPKPLYEPKRLLIMTCISVFLLASLAGAYYCYAQYNAAVLRLDDLTIQLNSLQSKKAEIERAEKQLESILKRQHEVQLLIHSYPGFCNYMNGIASSLTEDVWLSEIKFSPSLISINGKSMSFSIIGDVLKNLKLPIFNSARLLEVNDQESEGFHLFNFVIEIGIQGGGVEYAQQ